MNRKEELKDLYRQRRECLFYHGKIPRMVRLRKILHPFVINSARLESKISGRRVTVVSDNRSSLKGPFIYACSHVGWDDIQMTFESLHDHAWLFWGNPEYRTLHYYVLLANGAVCVDTYHKADRGIAKETAIRLLQKGESLLIYPEGAWNIIPNLPVMKLFTGAAEMAVSAGVDIVPIGISQSSANEFFISFGENISTSEYGLERKKEITQILRDRMATEVWKTWEVQPRLNRQSLPQDAEQEFYDFLESQMHGVFTIKDCENERYHDQIITSPDNVFAHLNALIPCRENAFLFNKRLSLAGKVSNQ